MLPGRESSVKGKKKEASETRCEGKEARKKKRKKQEKKKEEKRKKKKRQEVKKEVMKFEEQSS